ncbi:hypothetical protein [Kitasatospora sp. NBC_01250]|nr:hypothetical protein [Kitasatospora sp. NBC_01250]
MTLKQSASSVRPEMLYWRIWRAPSGSTTCTETYCPGRSAGSGPPSSGRTTKVTTSAVSWRRPATR